MGGIHNENPKNNIQNTAQNATALKSISLLLRVWLLRRIKSMVAKKQENPLG